MIGILDSGVGGLSVFREIIRLLPDENITYLADTRNCPYGNRTKEQIIELSTTCVDYLKGRGADIVVIACNTITSAAVSTLRSHNPTTPIVGMEPALKPAAQKSLSKTVAVLATQATLGGELYQATKDHYAADVEIIEIPGQGLVEIVENQTQNQPQSIALLRSYIEPLVKQGVDTLVLGCTHYPFLTPQINQITHGTIELVDPAPAVAKRTREVMTQHELLKGTKSKKATYEFHSTGDQQATQRLEQMAQAIIDNIK